MTDQPKSNVDFFFYKINILIFFKIRSGIFRFRVSNNLDSDQAWHYVRPDLGPNCFQQKMSLAGI